MLIIQQMMLVKGTRTLNVRLSWTLLLIMDNTQGKLSVTCLPIVVKCAGGVSSFIRHFPGRLVGN